MMTLSIRWLAVCQLLACCLLPGAFASPPSPLDDTPCVVDLDPGTSRVLACTPVSITVSVDMLDARVFELRLAFDPARLQFTAAVPGSESSLHLMPPSVTGGLLLLDGFFHPNFTGATLLATLTFYVNPVTGDDTATVRFESGQGWSGTESNPVPVQFSGDSAVIYIEGTPPDPPAGLLISRLEYPAHDDSVRLQWHPIFHDVDGDTVINPLYVIYREHVVAGPGVFDSVGATSDTFFYDASVSLNPDTSIVRNAATLHVVSRKTQP